MVVAIDGPAGAGKNTVARALARELGFTYLDSGAMYRTVALLAMRAAAGGQPGADPSTVSLAASVAADLQIALRDRITANGKDVTDAIRRPEVSEAASRVATDPK